MRPEVKFCGLTRPDDVDCAVELGATHLGFVFANSPRRTSPAQVAVMTREIPAEVRRVGVFVDASVEDLSGAIRIAGLQVVQLHDHRLLACVPRLREAGVEIWVVLHVVDGHLPPAFEESATRVDGVVLDTRVGKRVGGTGVPFDWEAARADVETLRPLARVCLAGGLRPENVGQAIRALNPDLVDVSSGVEAQPGVKDPRRMRAFMQSVREAALA